MEQKILIIEDLDVMRNVLTTNIRRAGYVPITAKNGEEGLDIAKEKVPDLVITDLMMPVMDGFKFIELFKKNENFKNIPIIVLTAKEDKEDVLKAIRLGANEYLVKPFKPKELLKRVKNLLGE